MEALPQLAVLPRANQYKHLPIVAIDERTGHVVDEDGSVQDIGRFTEFLPLSESCIVVACHTAWLLALFQRRWETTPGWISRTTRRERALYDPGLAKYGITVGITNAVPHVCGWRRPSASHCTFRKEFHFLDPDLFYGSEKIVQDVFGDPRDFTATKLMQWAQTIRLFCQENGLPVKQTQGALGAKFLTDSRFYPRPRRKVPKATNDRLRPHLPGNHSRVVVRTSGKSTCFNGHYLDQRRAHHFHARATRLPCANSLFAYGDFARLERISLGPDAFLNGEFHGVVAGDFTPPKRRVTFLPPRWRRRTVSRCMVSTAEWPWLADLGVECLGLYAAWGSAEADTGIPAYAEYAERELDVWSDRAAGATWLKSILVSTYGALAVNIETHFDTLIGGAIPEGREGTSWPAGSEQLHGYLLAHTKGNALEPGTTNVLHRYLIEAATRTESLSFANHLDRLGYWVLMIHVDAIIVEDDEERPIPTLFDPWRYKSKLTGLVFHDNCSFESLELTRMPGRPHLRERRMVAVRPSSDFRYEPGLLPVVAEP